ncbi:DUF4398 domain-containing protein [Pendulispora rubella]|uniref:DUF4398 domain-containing protein n=1 Tax=Pendulispora rubella TaxID=2741070 RepID=A0ABZ2LAZ1_9BACT
MKQIALTAAATITAWLMAGCGSYPAPNGRLADSQASVRAAQEVGAQNNPQAALHLKLAQEQIDQAKALINDGDNKRAEFVLLRAEADAELAVALARESTARAEAQQALDELKSLKSGDRK